MAKVCHFRRARSTERKAERRAALLEAAGSLLDERGVEGVSLTALAKAVGLSKSNVYTYFESREHVLLELLYEEWSAWLGEAELSLVAPQLAGDPAAVASALSASFVQRPRLGQLASVVTSVLERNVSEQAIAEFKTRALSLGIRATAMLHGALPELTLERAMVVLKAAFALVAGLWPAAHPPEAVRKVLERPEFAPHRVDFEPALSQSLTWLLRGALA